MIRFFICILIFLFSYSLRGQEDFIIGKAYTIDSSILVETCHYWVSVPTDYDADSKQSYPLIILLDGEKYFPVVQGMKHMYSSGKTGLMPAAILVGLKSNDRTRDFTPTASAMGRDGKVMQDAQPMGGGSTAYMRFIREELLPALEKQFPLSDQRLLIGHSFAGLFAMSTFISQPTLFTHYLILDPSVWWDNGCIIEQTTAKLSESDHSNQKIYIGFATKESQKRLNLHMDKADKLLSILHKKEDTYQLISHRFTNESHGTIFIQGFLDGIKKLYEQ